jgi:hypothetical protein
MAAASLAPLALFYRPEQPDVHFHFFRGPASLDLYDIFT